MTRLGWPHDLMTLAEFEDLAKVPDRHYELQEGIPFVSPLPPSHHEGMVSRLAATLGPQLPAAWQVVRGATVVTGPEFPAFVRRPDLVVVPAETSSSLWLDAGQVRWAIEIMWLGTRTRDALVKPIEYAGAGIADYWVIDPDEPVSATIYHLGEDGRYRDGSTVTGTLSVTEPFPVSVDLTELLSPQKRRVDQ